MPNNVYTRHDLQNLYLEQLSKIKETHINCAVEYIKRRVLAAATKGLDRHIVRRFGTMLEGTYALQSLTNNGLLENDAIARECLDQIVERLRLVFPDSYIDANNDAIYISWELN